ncbi:cellulase [Mycena belliarum]|uniref:Cellulase n=1 Tax=Mycena belliarum TaxID=1033014 RepID=A0AAD6U1K6_9AGAR|nr:cellulase [Mycena belliae]
MLPSLGVVALWLGIFATAITAAIPAWTPPLSTRGRYVVDANGDRFKLKSGNWHGGSGTWSGSGDINDDANHRGENAHTMPLGLQYVPIAQIIDSFEEIGLNSIRLQFSSEMIHDTTPVQDAWVAANPQFRGMTPLQVYDAVVKALTDRGFAVIVNNHTGKSLWCCGIDGNERWNTSRDFNTWVNDWLFVVNRYRDNKRVAGADLYNEVRRNILTDPNWGSGDDADWQRASQLAADQIMLANPDILIIVEGINWTGIPVDGFPHGRPTLSPVGGLSHTLLISHKLVYSAHFYGYTGQHHSGANGIGETTDARYHDLSRADLFSVVHDTATYVAQTAEMHYTAPVWISEFGAQGRGNGDSRETAWFQNFIDLLVEADADFAYWPLVGYMTDGWGLMVWDKSGNRRGLYDGDDWRAPAWKRLVGANSASGQIAVVPEWKMLTLEHGDVTQSYYVRKNKGDWDNGATKAVCPDNLRLVGLSHGANRALCTDHNYGAMWADDRALEVVYDERYVNGDWANGYTKYTCPGGYFVNGYAIRGTKVSTVMCAKASRALGSNRRTVWFDQGDNRADTRGGDFAYGQFKGQCDGNEYVAGVAFTTRIFANGAPSAILCVA